MEAGHSGGLSRSALEAFDPVPVVVFITRGPDHRLVYTNTRFQETFGKKREGAPIRDSFTNVVQQQYFDLVDQVWNTGKPFYAAEAPMTVRSPGPGSETMELYFTVSISPVTLDKGERGVLVVAMEATEQVNATRKIRVLSEERRRSLQRYLSLIEAGTHMVWATDPTGAMVEMSPKSQRLLGLPWEELRGWGWIRCVHPDDLADLGKEWWTAAEQDAPLFEHVYRIRVADGSYRHFRIRGAPVRQDGTVVEWVGTSTDVEEEWQEQRREALLARASAAAEADDLEEFLSGIAQVIVPDLADGCGIYMLPDVADRQADAPTAADRVAGAVGPGLPTIPPHRRERFAPDSPFMRAVLRRRPVHMVFPPGAPPPRAMPPGTEMWAATAKANSSLLLPIATNGDVAAVVHTLACGDRPPLNTSDISLIGQMLELARTPLNKLMDFRRTQRIALAMQRSLLTEPPKVPGLEITARYRPSRAEAEVGGDWYDSFVLPDGVVALTIGDVAGHDLSAAVSMSQYRNMLRALVIDHQEPPGEILQRLDFVVGSLYRESTATCVYARIKGIEGGPWILHYSVAGHPPPLLVSPNGECHFLESANNPLIGLEAGAPRSSAEESLPPFGTVLLYTDGLVEHPGEHLDEGLARLARHARALAGKPLDRFCDDLLAELALTERDDIAMIAVRCATGAYCPPRQRRP